MNEFFYPLFFTSIFTLDGFYYVEDISGTSASIIYRKDGFNYRLGTSDVKRGLTQKVNSRLRLEANSYNIDRNKIKKERYVVKIDKSIENAITTSFEFYDVELSRTFIILQFENILSPAQLKTLFNAIVNPVVTESICYTPPSDSSGANWSEASW